MCKIIDNNLNNECLISNLRPIPNLLSCFYNMNVFKISAHLNGISLRIFNEILLEVDHIKSISGLRIKKTEL